MKTITTVPAMMAAQIESDKETEQGCHQLLADKNLPAAKRKLIGEVLEVITQRRCKAQAGLAARLALHAGRAPNRVLGRRPSPRVGGDQQLDRTRK